MGAADLHILKSHEILYCNVSAMYMLHKCNHGVDIYYYYDGASTVCKSIWLKSTKSGPVGLEKSDFSHF